MNDNMGISQNILSPLDLATVFGEVLGVEDVTEDDNFFDLGGHSLLAVVLVGALEQDWHLELGPEVILAHQTPRGIFEHLSSRAADAG
jgi:acyl carrier protein